MDLSKAFDSLSHDILFRGYLQQSEYTEFQKMCLLLSFTRIYMYILLTITVQKIKSKIKL